MRLVLNLSMFINFMGRYLCESSRLISTIRYPDFCLQWRDIKLYVSKSAEGGIEFAANVRLTNMKGMKDTPDQWKEVSLKLTAGEVLFRRQSSYYPICSAH